MTPIRVVSVARVLRLEKTGPQHCDPRLMAMLPDAALLMSLYSRSSSWLLISTHLASAAMAAARITAAECRASASSQAGDRGMDGPFAR